MTRIQEIKEMARGKSQGNMAHFNIIVKTAQWADETMIERVCDWISDNMKNYSAFDSEMIKDLRKSMENG